MTTIRLATSTDVPRLATLRRAWSEEIDGPVSDPGYDARFASWFARELTARRFWLAEDAATPVGMLNLLVFERMPRPGHAGSGWGYIANVFVLAPLRDQGIGRLLVDAAIAYAKEQRFSRLVLNPSERSIPFYRRAGFTSSGLLQLDLE